MVVVKCQKSDDLWKYIVNQIASLNKVSWYQNLLSIVTNTVIYYVPMKLKCCDSIDADGNVRTTRVEFYYCHWACSRAGSLDFQNGRLSLGRGSRVCRSRQQSLITYPLYDLLENNRVYIKGCDSKTWNFVVKWRELWAPVYRFYWKLW